MEQYEKIQLPAQRENCQVPRRAEIRRGRANNFSSILGGIGNTVSGAYSSILGGAGNYDGGLANVFIAGSGIGPAGLSPNTLHPNCLNAVNTPNIPVGVWPLGTIFRYNVALGPVPPGALPLYIL